MGTGWTGRRKACPVIRLAEGRETEGGQDEDTPGVRVDGEEVTNGVHTTIIGYSQAPGQCLGSDSAKILHIGQCHKPRAGSVDRAGQGRSVFGRV